MVPTFGISDWFEQRRAQRLDQRPGEQDEERDQRRARAPWRAQTSAGGVSPSTSTRRPAYQISQISSSATARTDSTVQAMTGAGRPQVVDAGTATAGPAACRSRHRARRGRRATRRSGTCGEPWRRKTRCGAMRAERPGPGRSDAAGIRTSPSSASSGFGRLHSAKRGPCHPRARSTAPAPDADDPRQGGRTDGGAMADGRRSMRRSASGDEGAGGGLVRGAARPDLRRLRGAGGRAGRRAVRRRCRRGGSRARRRGASAARRTAAAG